MNTRKRRFVSYHSPHRLRLCCRHIQRNNRAAAIAEYER
jgi:hypothetical protein